jgi:hypothetical protein
MTATSNHQPFHMGWLPLSSARIVPTVMQFVFQEGSAPTVPRAFRAQLCKQLA